MSYRNSCSKWTHCRPWSDAAFCCVCSESALFASYLWVNVISSTQVQTVSKDVIATCIDILIMVLVIYWPISCLIPYFYHFVIDDWSLKLCDVQLSSKKSSLNWKSPSGSLKVSWVHWQSDQTQSDQSLRIQIMELLAGIKCINVEHILWCDCAKACAFSICQGRIHVLTWCWNFYICELSVGLVVCNCVYFRLSITIYLFYPKCLIDLTSLPYWS